MSTTPTPLPGNPAPSTQQQELQTLWSAIVAGVTEVRFQDRTVRYASVKDMIAAYNFAVQTGAGNGCACGCGGPTGVAGAGGPGGPNRQIRMYTQKGL
jgi:hypothetical protein